MDFEAFYRRTFPRVLSYARTLAPAADADDAVAEAYAIAWRKRKRIPADAELGWVIGVTRRVLANRRRGERRLAALRLVLGAQSATASPDPAEQITDGRLKDALMTLAPLDREALLLVAWFELSQAEAATALGIAPAAFRMRVTRARRRLRASLDDQVRLKEDPRWQTS